VQLQVSADQGRTWLQHAEVAPDQGFFTFNAQHDGMYWFGVRTIDDQGMAYPATMEGAQPQRKVAVDTRAPEIVVRALPPRDGHLGVEWDIRDDNLDLQRLRLEYHLPNTAEWLTLPITPAATGSHYWRPGAGGTLEVRMSAVDKAGNGAESKTNVASTG